MWAWDGDGEEEPKRQFCCERRAKRSSLSLPLSLLLPLRLPCPLSPRQRRRRSPRRRRGRRCCHFDFFLRFSSLEVESRELAQVGELCVMYSEVTV